MKIALLFVLALGISGCGAKYDDQGGDSNGSGGSGGSGVLATMGMLGVPAPTLIGQNVMLVDASLNGHTGGRLLVDTGSPFTLVNAGRFAGATLPLETQVSADIGIGALTIDQVPSIQITGGAMDQLRLAGILGGNVLSQFSTSFNYRDREFQIGGQASPSDVLSPVDFAFKLSGGGAGTLGSTVVRYGATRVPVTVTIEGTDHAFVLDTGASDVSLRTSVFTALVADGRPTIDDMPVSTLAGPASARVARSRSVSVAGQEVTNIPVLSFDDAIIDSISNELGHTVDGLLGGDYLREFLVTIDYPSERVVLRRYAKRDHIVDEFKRVGLWLTASSSSSFSVSGVHHGGRAEQLGVSVGDEVVSVDGQMLSKLDLFTADALLSGAVGSSHRIGFGQTRDATLAQSEQSIPVEDLVPLTN